MKTFIFALILFSLQAQSQDYTLDKETGKAVPSFIGQLRLVQGKVYKKAQGKLIEVFSGERFFEGNSLVTGKDATAKLMMVDESIISLGPEGEILFKKFLFKDKDNRNCEYELIKGQLRGNVPQKLKSGSISFKTKFSTMGIRGTQVFVNHQVLKGVEVSEFALIEGKAELRFGDAQFTGLSPRDHIVIVGSKDGKTARESGQIEEKKFESLKAESMNEEKEMKPFLPYLNLAELAQTSSLRPILLEVPRMQDNEKPSSDSQKTPKNWKESLKKLNDQLKKNQN
jgi:hypothetical protein